MLSGEKTSLIKDRCVTCPSEMPAFQYSASPIRCHLATLRRLVMVTSDLIRPMQFHHVQHLHQCMCQWEDVVESIWAMPFFSSHIVQGIKHQLSGFPCPLRVPPAPLWSFHLWPERYGWGTQVEKGMLKDGGLFDGSELYASSKP